MGQPNSPLKNRILLFFAILFTGLMVTFWVGKDPAVLNAEQEKMVAPVAAADTDHLAWNEPLTDTDGNVTEIKTLYNDKPVYVIFWMPWSDESMAQIDALMPVYERYHEKVHIILVAFERGRKEALSIASQKKWPMPIYTAPMGMASDYGITSVPTSVIIRKGGQIERLDRNVITPKQISYGLEEAIAKSPVW